MSLLSWIMRNHSDVLITLLKGDFDFRQVNHDLVSAFTIDGLIFGGIISDRKRMRYTSRAFDRYMGGHGPTQSGGRRFPGRFQTAMRTMCFGLCLSSMTAEASKLLFGSAIGQCTGIVCNAIINEEWIALRERTEAEEINDPTREVDRQDAGFSGKYPI